MKLGGHTVSDKNVKLMRDKIKEASALVLTKEQKESLQVHIDALDNMGNIFSRSERSLTKIIDALVLAIKPLPYTTGLAMLIFVQTYDLAKTIKDQKALNEVGALLSGCKFVADGDYGDLFSAVKDASETLKDNEMYAAHKAAWSSARNLSAYRAAQIKHG